MRNESREIILKIDIEVCNLNMKIDMIYDDEEKVKKNFFIYSNEAIIEHEFMTLHWKSHSSMNSQLKSKYSWIIHEMRIQRRKSQWII